MSNASLASASTRFVYGSLTTAYTSGGTGAVFRAASDSKIVNGMGSWNTTNNQGWFFPSGTYVVQFMIGVGASMAVNSTIAPDVVYNGSSLLGNFNTGGHHVTAGSVAVCASQSGIVPGTFSSTLTCGLYMTVVAGGAPTQITPAGTFMFARMMNTGSLSLRQSLGANARDYCCLTMTTASGTLTSASGIVNIFQGTTVQTAQAGKVTRSGSQFLVNGPTGYIMVYGSPQFNTTPSQPGVAVSTVYVDNGVRLAFNSSAPPVAATGYHFGCMICYVYNRTTTAQEVIDVRCNFGTSGVTIQPSTCITVRRIG